MADKQITPFQLTDQFTMDNFNQRINETNIALQSKPNPNLLDNWYFRNPINQRQGRIVKPNTTYYSDNQLTTAAGTTGAYVTAYRYATGTANGVNYASFKLEDSDTAPTYYAAPENVVRGYTGAGYGIDRWAYHANANVLIKDGYIELSTSIDSDIYFMQKFEKSLPTGAVFTFSVLEENGALTAITQKIGDSTVNGVLSSGGGFNLSATRAAIFVNNTTASEIKAIKLELGSQQTLAHQDENGNWVLNEIPDYGEQLARCQRYFAPELRGICVPSGIGDYCAAYAKLPVTMRTAPVFDTGDVQIAEYGSPTIHKSLNGWETAPDGINYINFTGAGNYVGKGIGVIFKNISAEL